MVNIRALTLLIILGIVTFSSITGAQIPNDSSAGCVKYTLVLYNNMLLPGNAVIKSNQTVPEGMAYDPQNGYIYVASCTTPGYVYVINSQNNEVVTKIRVGDEPYGVVYDPQNGYIYVTNAVSNTVSVIDPSTNKVIATIRDLGVEPVGITYDPLNGYIYVADFNSSSVSVINPSTNKVIANITVGPEPTCITYDPQNGYIYVTKANCIVIIDPYTNTTVGYVSTLLGYASISYIKGYLYVAVSNPGNAVLVINASTNKIIATINRLVNCPTSVAYDPQNGYLYIANYNSNFLLVINPSTDQIIDSIPVGTGSSFILYDPSNGYLYVTHPNSGTISIISTSTDCPVVIPTIYLVLIVAEAIVAVIAVALSRRF